MDATSHHHIYFFDLKTECFEHIVMQAGQYYFLLCAMLQTCAYLQQSYFLSFLPLIFQYPSLHRTAGGIPIEVYVFLSFR